MLIKSVLYYLGCTTRNRVLGIARRMRQPKYLIGVIAIVAYVYFFFVKSDLGDSLGGPSEKRQMAEAGLALMALVQIAAAWLVQGRGIAFRESEVQFLFPRPFSRFQLLMFKWLVGIGAQLFSALILALLFARGVAFELHYFVLGFVLFQAVLSAHSLLFTLCRSQIKTRARYLPGIALVVSIPVCAVFTWETTGGATDPRELIDFTNTRPLSHLLGPLKLLAAPIVAQTAVGFAKASVIPLIVLLVHLIAIRIGNLSFEDEALKLAAKIQEVRRSGLRGLRSKKKLVLAKPGSPWPLAPVGQDWIALVWKNVISISRLSRQTIFRIVGAAFILAYVVSTRGGDLWGGVGATRVGFILLAVLGYVTVLGPSLLRVDLRIDIPHFDVLKSMPIRARSLIFGEVMGTVVVLWFIQVVVCVIAAIFITQEDEQVFGWDMKAPLLGAMLCFLLAFDFLILTGENLLALWMPGFVRLGRGAKPSLDQMGPYIVGGLAKLIGMFILSLPAALFGTAIGYACHWLQLSEVHSISIGIVSGSIILAWAGFAAIQLSESRYNRFDLSSERATAE